MCARYLEGCALTLQPRSSIVIIVLEVGCEGEYIMCRAVAGRLLDFKGKAGLTGQVCDFLGRPVGCLISTIKCY